MTDLLRPSLIAKVLGLSPRTIGLWITNGKLPGLNIATQGKRPSYRVAKTDLKEFLITRGMSASAVNQLFK